MYQEKVAYEVAAKEVNAWIAKHKIFPRRLESLQEAVETLIEATMYGVISFKETGEVEQILQFPIMSEDGTPYKEKLDYKARLNVPSLTKKLEAIKTPTTDARLQAYASELTTTPVSIIQKLYPVDATVCQNICVFFM